MKTIPGGDRADFKFDLGSQIRDYSKVIGRRIDYVHRSLGMFLFKAIVYDTPLDTGLARGSWVPSVGTPVMASRQRIDKDGSAVIKEIDSVVMKATIKDVLFLTNGVPYIVALEYGHSQRQAPDGMVRTNVVKLRGAVSEIVARAKEVK